jgi:hypothetical protein
MSDDAPSRESVQVPLWSMRSSTSPMASSHGTCSRAEFQIVETPTGDATATESRHQSHHHILNHNADHANHIQSNNGNTNCAINAATTTATSTETPTTTNVDPLDHVLVTPNTATTTTTTTATNNYDNDNKTTSNVPRLILRDLPYTQSRNQIWDIENIQIDTTRLVPCTLTFSNLPIIDFLNFYLDPLPSYLGRTICLGRSE